MTFPPNVQRSPVTCLDEIAMYFVKRYLQHFSDSRRTTPPVPVQGQICCTLTSFGAVKENKDGDKKITCVLRASQSLEILRGEPYIFPIP